MVASRKSMGRGDRAAESARAQADVMWQATRPRRAAGGKWPGNLERVKTEFPALLSCAAGGRDNLVRREPRYAAGRCRSRYASSSSSSVLPFCTTTAAGLDSAAFFMAPQPPPLAAGALPREAAPPCWMRLTLGAAGLAAGATG
jgi:hypothetical protein